MVRLVESTPREKPLECDGEENPAGRWNKSQPQLGFAKVAIAELATYPAR
jgi:hypothetical protein